MYKTNL